MKTLITEDYDRTCTFEIVDKYPDGYIVWPIGRLNFPFDGYIPLAKPTGKHYGIDPNTLKAIKVDDCIANYILKKATVVGVNIATLDLIAAISKQSKKI